MADDTEALGPISYLIVEFPGNKMTGEGFASLLDLVDRGVIRILDLMFVTRDTDGSMRALELQDIDHDGQFDLAVFAGASSGLLGESDLSEAASVIEPGSAAGILIFENRWATPFIQALRRGEADSLPPATSPRRPGRGARRRRRLIQREKGRDHATSPRSGTYRSHRRNGHRCVEPFASPAKSVGAARRTAVRATTAVRPSASTGAGTCVRPHRAAEGSRRLKSQGILTQAEFDAQKAKVLAS